VPSGTIGEESGSRGAVTCSRHRQAFGCDILQSPDAARLLPSRVDWPPGTFTCFSWELLVPAMWLSLHFYTSPCAHAFRLGDTIRFICTRNTSSWCADMHLTPSSRQSQDGFSQWYTRRDLRLAIMPTGSVVCMRRPPMRDVGTCPMIEATYSSNTRHSMRIDESVARSQNSHVAGMCVRCAAVGHKKAEGLSCDGC
jgi:hypothetical protein